MIPFLIFVTFLETLFGMCPDSPRCTFHCSLCSAAWSLVHFSSTQATKIVIANIKCILASREHPTGARVSRSFPSTVSPGSCLNLVIQYKASERVSRSRELVIHSDDPHHPVRYLDVIAYTIWDCCKCCEPEKCCCKEERKDCCDDEDDDDNRHEEDDDHRA